MIFTSTRSTSGSLRPRSRVAIASATASPAVVDPAADPKAPTDLPPMGRGEQPMLDGDVVYLLPSEDADHDAAEARLMLAPAIRRLSERDRLILHLRFFKGLTQEEIAQEIGVTQMHVSRLLSKILNELRTEIS